MILLRLPGLGLSRPGLLSTLLLTKPGSPSVTDSFRFLFHSFRRFHQSLCFQRRLDTGRQIEGSMATSWLVDG